MNIGIIIIGRNEGERLQRAFESVQIRLVPNNVSAILYVDSGSIDGSTELALSRFHQYLGRIEEWSRQSALKPVLTIPGRMIKRLLLKGRYE